MGFLEDCKFAVVLDRCGNADIVTHVQGRATCSPALGDWVADLTGYKYKPTEGRWSHVVGLSEYIPAVNLSVGFYNEHLRGEKVAVSEVLATTWVVEAILSNHAGQVDAKGKPINQKYHQPFGVVAEGEAFLSPHRSLVFEFPNHENADDGEYHPEEWFRAPVWIVRKDVWRKLSQ